MSISKETLRKLKKIGYELIKNSKPRKYLCGGQFSGGYSEVNEEYALAQLRQVKEYNKIWQMRFGKNYIDLD